MELAAGPQGRAHTAEAVEVALEGVVEEGGARRTPIRRGPRGRLAPVDQVSQDSRVTAAVVAPLAIHDRVMGWGWGDTKFHLGEGGVTSNSIWDGGGVT